MLFGYDKACIAIGWIKEPEEYRSSRGDGLVAQFAAAANHFSSAAKVSVVPPRLILFQIDAAFSRPGESLPEEKKTSFLRSDGQNQSQVR